MGEGAERRQGGLWSEEEEGGEGRRGSLLCSLSDFSVCTLCLKAGSSGEV